MSLDLIELAVLLLQSSVTAQGAILRHLHTHSSVIGIIISRCTVGTL